MTAVHDLAEDPFAFIGRAGSDRPPAALPELEVVVDISAAALLGAIRDDRRHLNTDEGQAALAKVADYTFRRYTEWHPTPQTGWQALEVISTKAGATDSDRDGLVRGAISRHLQAIATGEEPANDIVAAAHAAADNQVVWYLAQLLRAPSDPDRLYPRLIGHSRYQEFRERAGKRLREYVDKVDWDAAIRDCLLVRESQHADYFNAVLVAQMPRPRKKS